MARTNINFPDDTNPEIAVSPLEGLTRLVVDIGDVSLYLGDDAAHRLEASLARHRMRRAYRLPPGDGPPVPAEAATAIEEARSGDFLDADDLFHAAMADAFELRGLCDVGDALIERRNGVVAALGTGFVAVDPND